MKAKKSRLKFILVLIVFFNYQYVYPCSSYKVTANGKTMVGSNYDTWLTTPRIWFETNGYGTAFTGARFTGESGFAPQTGMNEYGLAFVTLASATPENGSPSPNKKQIVSRTNYLKDILHQCKTVDEVKIYVEQYDHSTLNQEVFLYADKSGRYLIVEPYTATIGDENKYVLANFCPSTITDFSTIKQIRYKNGTEFLKNKINSSIEFCTALSDTMHVCRKKLGDGTMLTSILDLNDGIYYLYFYHDYSNQVKFNLKEELSKGDHFIEISLLFPVNKEFKQLINFKTPSKSSSIDYFMRYCVVLFSISAVFFLFNYFIKRKSTLFAFVKLLLVPLSLIMVFYIFTLVTNENIFYFPAPYTDGTFSLVSISSYIPFLIILIIIPLFIINKKVIKNSIWGFFPKWLLTLNSLTYLALIFLFSYWGLYAIFN